MKLIRTLADYAERRREMERLLRNLPPMIPAPGNAAWDRFKLLANAVADFERNNGMRIKP